MPKYSKKEGYQWYTMAKGGHGTKKEKGYQYPTPQPKMRPGWDDSYVKTSKKKDKYPAKKSDPKRKGWSDHGDGMQKMPYRYEDGGVVNSIEDRVKTNSLEMLIDEMASLGGENLFGQLQQKFQDGGVVQSESFKDYDDGQDDELSELSREELIQLLKSRR